MKVLKLSVTCILCLLLCACLNTAESSSDKEMKIMDENLQLKRKNAELVSELEALSQQEELEKELEQVVIQFFLDASTGEIEQANQCTTSNIEVVNSSEILENGRMRTEIWDANEQFLLQPVSLKWESEAAICASFNLLTANQTTSLHIYLNREESEWKIDNIAYNYDAENESLREGE
ncbi:MAG: hypothetical protein ACI35P_10800 [Bacillus sp. (in: firmicutes)]